jgi:hypothetical protein
MRRAILGKADDFGTRWSYDRTIYVRSAQSNGYLIHDEITKTSWTRQSLDAARQVVEHVIDSRPQIEWASDWTGGDRRALEQDWSRVSADGRVSVSADRDAELDWWTISITVAHEPWPRCFSWRVEGYIKGAVVRAQATAWAAHKAMQEESP